MVDANIQHAIAYAKLLIKAPRSTMLRLLVCPHPLIKTRAQMLWVISQDNRAFPQLNAEEARLFAALLLMRSRAGWTLHDARVRVKSFTACVDCVMLLSSDGVVGDGEGDSYDLRKSVQKVLRYLSSVANEVEGASFFGGFCE